ncbi:VRR-NUC domain-containing protein [Trinickia sp. LjRoot230]|uniref:VRR-NUC domain-containing protein n=1 Tax=Trinickia sp. LjRoot230 TaxID=3342288 RepID=UPI003ECF32D6
MPNAISSPNAPYYLLNFERALAWISERYNDLFDALERAFLIEFGRLPLVSRALLVRMLMRKGPHFRASKLRYDEIGCPLQAAAPLVSLGWVNADTALTIEELFPLVTRAELSTLFGDAAVRKHCRKPELLDVLRATYGTEARPYRGWNTTAATPERVLQVTIAPLCDRLRLMFFGNLQQDWSEFVLADLGLLRYETVAFSQSARAFQRRADIDAYLSLQACREAFDALIAGDVLDESAFLRTLSEAAVTIRIENAWIEMRRAKLLYRIGYRAEQQQDWDLALEIYAQCRWPEARYRRIRVLERGGRYGEAFTLGLQVGGEPASEAEHQRVMRMLSRLARRLGEPIARRPPSPAIERAALVLARPAEPTSVEHVVRAHLHTPHAPAYYVENALINSLFGLLCWDAVFEPVQGAFFHPFQRGPADLHAPDFHTRRAEPFERCLAQLDTGAYRDTIIHHLHEKAGMQSPFVFWGVLNDELVTLALACLPAAHLKLWFIRLLDDIRSNRSGLPDLIRFWPDERRYELIEVKGPGDRLQDNQIRWLSYCAQHGMPTRVVDVRWADDAADALTGASA